MRYPEPRVLERVSGQLPGPCQNAEPCWGARGTFQNGRGGATGAFESVSTQWSPLFSFGLRAGWSRENHGSGAVVVALSLFCKLIRGVVSHLFRGQCTWTGKHFGGGAFVNLSMDNEEAPCTLARVTGAVSTPSQRLHQDLCHTFLCLLFLGLA